MVPSMLDGQNGLYPQRLLEAVKCQIGSSVIVVLCTLVNVPVTFKYFHVKGYALLPYYSVIFVVPSLHFDGG